MRVSPNLHWPTFMAQRCSSPVSALLNISSNTVTISAVSLTRSHTSLSTPLHLRRIFTGLCYTSLALNTVSDRKNLPVLSHVCSSEGDRSSLLLWVAFLIAHRSYGAPPPPVGSKSSENCCCDAWAEDTDIWPVVSILILGVPKVIAILCSYATV